MKPFILGVYGESNSGKTKLILKIIKQLSNEGFKLAIIKISDKKINIDTKGKDTWKHSKAGGKLVVLSSKNNTDFLLNQKIGILKIISQINCIDSFDLILIEGANDDFTQKIRIGDIKERKNTILSYKGDFQQLILLIKKEIIGGNNMKKMSIKVNGKQIGLTEFPEDIIKNTICGMLKSLKGVDEIKNVEIKFDV